MIRSTNRFSSSPTGWSSALKFSSNYFRDSHATLVVGGNF
jgi:hypothetical protein